MSLFASQNWRVRLKAEAVRVAIVHDWLVTKAGAERALEQILTLYPQADLFAVCDFLPERDRGMLCGRTPKTTFVQHLPFARHKYRSYLPLMPLAIEQIDLSGYDIVISSSHAVAKGVLVGPDQLHISCVHSPIRYAWDLQHQYLRESGLEKGLRSWLARWALHRMRIWDVRTANGVDVFVVYSHYIARRIMKTYRRPATMVPLAVDVSTFALREQKDDFYLLASRMVPYKRMDVVVEAFVGMPKRRLVVIGSGPQFGRIKRIARGVKNVEILGYQESDVLRDYMQRARAFVFAAEEDAGLMPVEAQACGTPVIAFGKGGVLDTVKPMGADDPTGVFFAAQTPEAIMAAVERFERDGHLITPRACRLNAERFSLDRFRECFSALVHREWVAFQSQQDSASARMLEAPVTDLR